MDTSWIAELNLVDLVAVIYLLYGMIRGFMRGLSGELARVIAMVVVFVLGWKFYVPLGEKLVEISLLDEQASQLAGFLLILVGAGMGTILVRWVLRNLVEFTFKEPLEKVGGVAAGLVRCGAWVALVIVAAILTPSEYLNRKFGEESQMGQLVAGHLLPAYQRLAEEMPELGLPAIPDGEIPPAVEIIEEPEALEEPEEAGEDPESVDEG